MNKRPYAPPIVQEIGTVRELTQENPTLDKCGGSSDLAYPQILSPVFLGDCPDA